MENSTENIFSKDSTYVQNTIFLDKIDGISIDSSRSAYGRPAMSNLDSPDHITLRMDQNSGPKNFGFQKGHSRAHFFGSSGANGSIEHTQTIVSICHYSHITGRPFPTKRAPPIPSTINGSSQLSTTTSTSALNVPEQKGIVCDSFGGVTLATAPIPFSNLQHLVMINNNYFSAEIQQITIEHSRFEYYSESAQSILLQQNQPMFIRLSPDDVMSLEEFQKSCSVKFTHFLGNMDSHPIPCTSVRAHSAEALRDVLSEPLPFWNNVQRVDTLASTLEKVHDVHFIMTLNDLLSEDTLINNTYIGAIWDLSFIPVQTIDSISFVLSKQQMFGSHTTFQSIIQPVHILRPLLVQPNSINCEKYEITCSKSIQSKLGDINSDLENPIFGNVLYGHFVYFPTSSDNEASYSSFNSTNQALLNELLLIPIRESDGKLNIQVVHLLESLKSDIYIYSPSIRKTSSSDSISSINMEMSTKHSCFRKVTIWNIDSEKFFKNFTWIFENHKVPIRHFPINLAMLFHNNNAKWISFDPGPFIWNIHWQKSASSYCINFPTYFSIPIKTLGQLSQQLQVLQLQAYYMEVHGLQFHSDQFITSAQKFNWNLIYHQIMFQFISSFSTWITDQQSFVASYYFLRLVCQSSSAITARLTDILAKLAIRILVNSFMCYSQHSQDTSPISRIALDTTMCLFCINFGHLFEICMGHLDSNILSSTLQLITIGSFIVMNPHHCNNVSIAIQLFFGVSNRIPIPVGYIRPPRKKHITICYSDLCFMFKCTLFQL